MRRLKHTARKGPSHIGGISAKVYIWNKYGPKKIHEIDLGPIAEITITADKVIILGKGISPERATPWTPISLTGSPR